MAKRTEVQVLDDITGEVGASERKFGLDGTHYAIDLSPANSDKLTEALRPFLDNARRIKGSALGRHTVSTRSPRTAASNGHSEPEVATAADRAIIREWWRVAATKRSDLSPFATRGKIPRDVVEAYREEKQKPVEIPTVEVLPAATNGTRRTGRQPLASPPVKELLGVWSQVGSYSGVADYFKVSQPVAKRWVTAALAD